MSAVRIFRTAGMSSLEKNKFKIIFFSKEDGMGIKKTLAVLAMLAASWGLVILLVWAAVEFYRLYMPA